MSKPFVLLQIGHHRAQHRARKRLFRPQVPAICRKRVTAMVSGLNLEQVKTIRIATGHNL
jgi:hypothetical protein